MKVETLKREGRRKEREEAWGEALEAYRKVAEVLEAKDDPDITLHNRMGDLELRLGNPDGALEQFERAVDLYVESGLLNNAVGVCKKVIRNLPDRDEPHLRLGRLRAEQGLRADAREAFVTYADRRQAKGSVDDALEALVEFADLAPEEVEVREMVAGQLASQGRTEEAVAQYVALHRTLEDIGETERAAAVSETVLELDPDADLSREAGAPGEPSHGDPLSLGTIYDPGVSEDEEGEEEDSGEGRDALSAPPASGPEASEEDETDDAVLEGGAILTGDDLPSVDDDRAEDEEGTEDAPLDPGEAVLSSQPLEETEDPDPETEPDFEAGWEPEPEPGSEAEGEPELEAEGKPEPEPASTLGAEPLSAPAPEAATDEGPGYVDLGALILGDGEEKDTRMRVPTQNPTGDEDADFARMLQQFKEKVAENLEADNARDHYDLGTAYQGMGLLDEAIAQLQQALRANPEELPVYEVLGQCFLERGEPRAAIQLLDRALRVPVQVEDDRLRIYYDLARSHEEVGNVEEAREFYEKVFSLDINFEDVTDRLRRVRTGETPS